MGRWGHPDPRRLAAARPRTAPYRPACQLAARALGRAAAGWLWVFGGWRSRAPPGARPMGVTVACPAGNPQRCHGSDNPHPLVRGPMREGSRPRSGGIRCRFWPGGRRTPQGGRRQLARNPSLVAPGDAPRRWACGCSPRRPCREFPRHQADQTLPTGLSDGTGWGHPGPRRLPAARHRTAPYRPACQLADRALGRAAAGWLGVFEGWRSRATPGARPCGLRSLARRGIPSDVMDQTIP